jgi:hypothetical protein
MNCKYLKKQVAKKIFQKNFKLKKNQNQNDHEKPICG